MAATGGDDFLVKLARPLLTLGIALIPASAIRLGGASLSDVLLVLSVLPAVGARVRGRHPGPIPAFATIGFWALAAGLCVSGFRAVDGTAHVGVAWRLLFAVMVLQWMLRVVARDERDLRLMVRAYCVGAAASGLAAGLQLAGLLAGSLAPVNQGRAVGLNLHPNGQGGALAVGVTMAVGMFAFSTRRAHRLSWFLISGACAGGLIFAGSVTGMMSGAAGVLVVAVIRGIRPLGYALTAAACWVAYHYVAAYQLSHGGTTPLQRFRLSTGADTVVGGESTLAARTKTMHYALDLLNHDFLTAVAGAGLDPSSLVAYNHFTPTHNFELLVWVQAGLLSLVGVLIVIAAAGYCLRRNRGSLRAPLMGGSVAALVVAQTGPVMIDRYFWFPLAAALPAHALARGTGTSQMQDDRAVPASPGRPFEDAES